MLGNGIIWIFIGKIEFVFYVVSVLFNVLGVVVFLKLGKYFFFEYILSICELFIWIDFILEWFFSIF